jgi:CRISPR-associated protein Cas1
MVLGHAFTPVAVVLPLNGHHAQAERFRAQVDATLPIRKQAWASLVRHKIAAQAEALDRVGQPSKRLQRLLTSVRSGDPDNREAQAAQTYWPLLMGRDFRRDRGADGANAMLNYGYAVLRAATARAIVSAGLHPSLSVHHRSGGDALVLADDLMEPFRPTVDLIVHRLRAEGRASVEDAREELVACLSVDFPTRHGTTPLSQVLVRLAQSLARSFLDRKLKLEFPSRPLPDELGETEHA